MSKKRFIAPFLCTLLEHYDKELFALIIPFIAPLFFSSADPISALIWGYALMPIGALSRPIGAWIFGQIGDRYGRRHCLVISSLGIAIATGAVACLPTYAQIGLLAPTLLGACRFAQNLFFPGQTTGSALIILEGSQSKVSSFLSGLFISIGQLGALIALTAIRWFDSSGQVEANWRWLFVAGALIGVIVFFVRVPKEEKNTPREKTDIRSLRGHLPRFLLATLMSGFAYGNLLITLSLLNGFVPLVANVTQGQMIDVGQWMIIVNMIAMPFFGWLCSIVGRDRLLLISSLLLALFAPLAFARFSGANFFEVSVIRMGLLILGSAITAPYYFWMKEIAPTGCRFTFIGLAKAAGLQLIGAPAGMACIWLYHMSGSLAVAGLYLSGLGLAAFLATALGMKVLRPLHTSEQ